MVFVLHTKQEFSKISTNVSAFVLFAGQVLLIDRLLIHCSLIPLIKNLTYEPEKPAATSCISLFIIFVKVLSSVASTQELPAGYQRPVIGFYTMGKWEHRDFEEPTCHNFSKWEPVTSSMTIVMRRQYAWGFRSVL